MESVIGIFPNWEAAERAAKSLGLPEDRYSVIAADRREPKETGIGGPLGGAVGGAVGAAAGSTIGTALASLAIPGVGPVVATGVVAAVLFGAGGVAAGAVAGDKVEQASEVRPAPADAFFVEEALRRGRVVVVTLAETPGQANSIRSMLTGEGAETLETIRQAWWREVRASERAAYGSEFVRDEQAYRQGFEAALEPGNRGKPLDEDAPVSSAYREGYRRGSEYYENTGKELAFRH
jgi:hypothetical protein